MKGLENVSAAILAGGLGTRLHSVIADRPKVLANVRGRPFLAYLLDQLDSFGFNDVVVCTGYMGDQVQAAFGESWGRLRLSYSRESVPLGTAGALRCALPMFKSDSVLVMNGDSFCEADLESMWSWHSKGGMDASILLARVPNTRRYGRVRVDANGLVLKFDEKSTEGGEGWINGGVYLLSRRLLLTIPTAGPVSLEREMFPVWLERGLSGYRGEGRFLDIGTPESYGAAQEFFAPNAVT